MSLPDQSPRKIGSKWDVVIQKLKEVHRKMMNKSSSANEIQILRTIQKSKEINKIINNYLNEQLVPILKKSSKLSEEIRSEGNKIYKNQGNLYESCFFYSLSIKCCENSLDLSYAHGNRAAALMKLGFNEVARNDCEEALLLGHPDPFKIYERLCSLSNGSISSMRRNLSGLEKHLKKSSKQSKEIIQKYKTRLKAMEKETYVDDEQMIDKLLLDDEGELKVKQMYESEVGRFVIAQKPISVNEKVFSEKPFAFVPVHNYGVKKYFNTDCENCALVNVFPFLCLECRHSTYCSSSCRESHRKIHKYECEGYKKNLFFEIGIAHLSLRVLIVGFPSLRLLLESLDRTEYKNNPEKILKLILEAAGKESEDYFKIKNNEFYEYARVLCLQPNLLRNDSFSPRNYPYVYVSIAKI